MGMLRIVRWLGALLAAGIAGAAAAQGGEYPAVKLPQFRLTFPLGWEVKRLKETISIRGPRGELFYLREASAAADLAPDKHEAEMKRLRTVFGDVARQFFLENKTQGEFFTEEVKRTDGSVKLTLTVGLTESWTRGQMLLQFIAAGPRTVIWMRGSAPAYSGKETVETIRKSFHAIEWQP